MIYLFFSLCALVFCLHARLCAGGRSGTGQAGAALEICLGWLAALLSLALRDKVNNP